MFGAALGDVEGGARDDDVGGVGATGPFLAAVMGERRGLVRVLLWAGGGRWESRRVGCERVGEGKGKGGDGLGAVAESRGHGLPGEFVVDVATHATS